MIKTIFLIACLCCFSPVAIEISAAARSESTFHYDRIEFLEHLIKVLYPDLAMKLASFDIVSTFEAGRGVTVRNVKFFPCRFITSVGVPTIEERIPIGEDAATPQSPPQHSDQPVCGADPTTEFQHFLDIAVGFTPGHQKHPIFKFHASGTYVDDKLEKVRENFTGKPYTSEDEILRFLHSHSPKFGPDNRSQFLESLPLSEIGRLTGCYLRPQSAAFVVVQDPQRLPPDLQWHISGNAPAAEGLPATKCWATFEPFDGHLTMFMD